MGIFDSLHIGSTGLSAAQIQISVTGQNVTNVNTEGYTRQRAVQKSALALDTIPGSIGTGTKIETVVRIHDEFVFNGLKSAYSNSQKTSYEQTILQEVVSYFPDLDDAGILDNLQKYYDAWNDFASNPNEAAQKTTLLSAANILTDNINSTSNNLQKTMDMVNDQIANLVDELNSIGKQIAQINKELAKVEANNKTQANDLRDKRDQLELRLAKMANITTFKDDLSNSSFADATITDQGMNYNLNINGVTLIEGGNFHEIKFDAGTSQYGYGTIFYELNDETRIDMSSKITSGELGAMLDLRGRTRGSDGYMKDGILSDFKDMLDTFARTLVIQTNNIYASGAHKSLASDALPEAKAATTLQDFDHSIKNGTFTVNVYDKNGTLMASKDLSVNPSTTLDDTRQGNSLVDDFNSNTDDNKDNNFINDVDDYFLASFSYDSKSQEGHFNITPKFADGEYYISIEDHGTNVPGALGLGKFLAGTNAGNISVTSEIKNDSSLIIGGKTPVAGDNSMANAIVNSQNTDIEFVSSHNGSQTATTSGYYRYFTTYMASVTESVSNKHATNEALYNNVYQEYQSVSGVNLDEELTNLIQFQSSYAAAAKVITTVDEMLDALLAMK